METTNVTKLFEYLDQTSDKLAHQSQLTYLEALAEAGDNLFEGTILQSLSPADEEEVQELLDKVKQLEWKQEEVRKAFQLGVIKGMKGAVQPNHSMTPDAVSLFISYLVNKLVQDRENTELLDLAVGSGNLLFAICNNATTPIEASGFEVDETLLKNAYSSANLQQHQIHLYHQDSLQVVPQKTDLVVSDLPIGYYPKDDVASSFELKAKEGHSYIHHLMIEQGIKSLNDGGFALFVIPNFLFESDQSAALHAYLKKDAVVLGLLQLPSSMFSNVQQQKSILLLQKKKEGIPVPQQALFAELPTFSNKEAMQDMVKQINRWFEEQLKR
ncbi:site-specific DNA-methyltransferase (adenine-specific) [Alkalihalobacillus xiaoxiensis]|uniref:Site-specific DNA-methyltransferase (Adenine-specific) n=1 Tax=Shouchella xiaoxiensis TaxID=766895 RepID=A0ABS2SSH6_9BACI|nr:class I SAM-dependent methyltransferase [Shouchella xiaoxiensis]MBM7838446.1 site-specific DNA-methyltransferase (adenine-specific) [Shouchella xiaoxiensis]